MLMNETQSQRAFNQYLLVWEKIEFKTKAMTALFIVAIAVFGYMCYVLIKPEKF